MDEEIADALIPPWCEHSEICLYISCWEYPNGFICSGFVIDNLDNYPDGDVICLCETYFDRDTNKDASRHNVTTVNEALATIQVLSNTIHRYNLYKKKHDTGGV